MFTTLVSLTLTLLLASLTPAVVQAEPSPGVQYKVCGLYFRHMARWYGEQGQFDAGEAALDLADTAAEKGRHPNIHHDIREIDLAIERFFLYHPIEENLPALAQRYDAACRTLLQPPSIDWMKRLFPTPEALAEAKRRRR